MRIMERFKIFVMSCHVYIIRLFFTTVSEYAVSEMTNSFARHITSDCMR